MIYPGEGEKGNILKLLSREWRGTMKGPLSLYLERNGATNGKIYALFQRHIPLPSPKSLIYRTHT